jgi:hypothetical protein
MGFTTVVVFGVVVSVEETACFSVFDSILTTSLACSESAVLRTILELSFGKFSAIGSHLVSSSSEIVLKIVVDSEFASVTVFAAKSLSSIFGQLFVRIPFRKSSGPILLIAKI